MKAMIREHHRHLQGGHENSRLERLQNVWIQEHYNVRVKLAIDLFEFDATRVNLMFFHKAMEA